MLKRRTVLVTGGASGIGLAAVEAFLAAGDDVVCADLQGSPSAAHAAFAESFAYVQCDVSRESDARRMVEETVGRFGRIDVLFNNAGYPGHGGDLADIDVDDFDRTLAVNVRGTLLGMKYAAPHLIAQRSGCIINMASAAGIRAGDAPHAYSVSKAAVIHLTKCVAMELAEHGVRVNAIAPGLVPTAIFGLSQGLDRSAADRTIETLERIGETFAPLPGGTRACDVAAAALFLASDAAATITGVVLPVDGGLTAGARWSTSRENWLRLGEAIGTRD